MSWESPHDQIDSANALVRVGYDCPKSFDGHAVRLDCETKMIQVGAGPKRQKGVLFILPSIPSAAAGPASTWIPAIGWAQAAAARWDAAWLATPLGVLTPGEALDVIGGPRGRSRLRDRTRGLLPKMIGTLKKDCRNVIRGIRSRRLGIDGPWETGELVFIWQRHELFQISGVNAARRFEKPLVLFVDAPVVWESEKWGTTRPGWGRVVERYGERPQLRRADLVCCVSEEVAEQVESFGVSRSRILVTPNATDTRLFHPRASDGRKRKELGLSGFVVGWIGSFRRFHGVELILEAVARLEKKDKSISVLLVGDGYERKNLEEFAASLNLRNAIFTGVIPYNEIPDHINSMDVAVISDPGLNSFHYSPLKLQEYMACGRPVIAPRSGQIEASLIHEVDALLVPPGDRSAIEQAIDRLYEDSGLRERIGQNARRRVVDRGGWSHQLERVERRLTEMGWNDDAA